MTESLWQEVSALALRLPGRGKLSVRVTRCDDDEYIAMATVNFTTGSGHGIGDADADRAIAILRRTP